MPELERNTLMKDLNNMRTVMDQANIGNIKTRLDNIKHEVITIDNKSGQQPIGGTTYQYSCVARPTHDHWVNLLCWSSFVDAKLSVDINC